MIMIWSGCGRKRLWPTVNKYPEGGLECLKATKKLANNSSSNQHLKFLTSRVWIKLSKIRHWNWEDAVCFVLFQLASGQTFSGLVNTFTTTVLNPLLAPLNSGLSSGQALAASAFQQLNGNLTAATQSIQATTQSTTASIQQAAASADAAIASANATSAQTQAQVQNCVAQANQNLSALNASTSK